MDSQKRLEILWLSDNNISALENLEPLENLTQFHCGNNKISKIGAAFHKNLKLQDILLAGNEISSFREILNLVHLPRLESLSLADPNFADNPISSLFNYQTHVILHLPRLHYLDSLQITQESRKIIGATVLKKIMYYNMRISTIKRNENIMIKTLNNHQTSHDGTANTDTKQLLRLRYHLARREFDCKLFS